MNRIILALASLSILSFVSPATSDPSKYRGIPATAPVVKASVAADGKKDASFDKFLEELYDDADLKQADLSFDVFKRAAVGYYNLKDLGKLNKNKNLLTVIDFGKPSREKRLWIIDLNKKKVLYHSLVAHGRGSGDDRAVKFSNVENSHMSSLGFYVTKSTYTGKHGLSLKMEGLDRNHNTNAYQRAIVVHAADYVSESFVKQHGRLGRSHGCPALPPDINAQVVQLIKDGTCLYIDAAHANYQSAFLSPDKAIKSFEAQIMQRQAEMLSK
ncbi:hypothetical protein TH61_14515 [Rufibacter sp. DG15C]|uniref:murein L,D-transpeptidase catalytic domain family protein n=1 Tax=Rufibacter sp. DG15C TaxID=1379909 RepID=UPI00078C5C29|nr:murein L,D-transpeptidase catalytic domain family protein [Rufibacter sp. DG15C]AMM52155.1 hypothetical protein TH61_14515 [Rufibacter sp. DG15C]